MSKKAVTKWERWGASIRRKATLERDLRNAQHEIERLTQQLELERDSNQYLREQLDGYRDAFQALQTAYQAGGVEATMAIDRMSKGKPHASIAKVS